MILTADLHLDDKPINDYRWQIFDKLRQHTDGDILILGDLCDRADRHSSSLVNRLIDSLTTLVNEGSRVRILCGNHDRALKPPPFWSFLYVIPKVSFITEPTADGDLLLLPFSPDPQEEWKELPFELYRCIMMHQTVNGVNVGHGRTIESPDLPHLPTNIPIYSGDIHYCQTIGNVTYVGAPHPVRFGDTHRCRFLSLGSDYRVRNEITLRRMRKSVIEIHSLQQLASLKTDPGDQARIRFVLPSGEMNQWPVTQAAISKWARENNIHLASVEAIIEVSPDKRMQDFNFSASPQQVLADFCRAEGLDVEMYQAGLDILRSFQIVE